MIWNPWKEIKRLREHAAMCGRITTTKDAVINQQVTHLRVLLESCHLYENALQHIASEEKPTSNATVKRMAKIAREALGI